MRTTDLVRAAVANSLRSRARTALTVLAIVIGAFTLTLTNGVGTGANRYITQTVSARGADDVLTVTHTPEEGEGPRRYDPAAPTFENDAGASDQTVLALDPADLDRIRAVPGVVSAVPVPQVTPDYVQHRDGARWQVEVASIDNGGTPQLAAGRAPDPASDEPQVALPVDHVGPLGFTDAAAAVGQTVTFGVTDGRGRQSTLAAAVVGIARPGLGGAVVASANGALAGALAERQSVGVPEQQADRWAAAAVRLAPGTDAAGTTAVQDRLLAEGFTGSTVADQLGSFTTVIDAIVLILNGFGAIALLAAGFGIVNTLFMAVQERTREIGLLKAMGLGRARVFALFSLEAGFIGVLGSVLGAALAIGAGTLASSLLAGGLLADLPGLTLIAFAPLPVVLVGLLVVGIALLAGTLPALRAARQDAITSLRHE